MAANPETILGAGEKSRTPDLRITNALLYQLSYAGLAGPLQAERAVPKLIRS